MNLQLRKNERGMVLLVVLLVVTLLVTILVEFSFSTLVDLRLAETYRDTTRAAYLAKGGIRAGQIILQEDRNGYDADDELWAQGVEGYPVGGGSISIRIEDHGGRLDLNRLVMPDGESISFDFKRRFLDLLELIGAGDPDALVDATIDWIDNNDSLEASGAESNYYRALQNPYNCKNAPLDNIEELILIRGYDHNLLTLLKPHITVHGSEKLNINTATAEVIQVWNDNPGRPDAGETIVSARQEKPFTNVSQVNTIQGIETFLTLNLAVTSNRYQVESTAFVNDGRRTIRASLEKNAGQTKIFYKRVL